MSKEDLYLLWAPESALWSRWAKPALFADLNILPDQFPDSGLAEQASAVDVGAIPDPVERCALMVELPGADSVVMGLALANRGYQPVPVFNGCDGPNPVVDVDPIIANLVRGAGELRNIRVRDDAPPAFLLDSRRMTTETKPAPGKFDNRWMVFPQDLPSANFLLSRGLKRVIVVQTGTADIKQDLAHVLLRWQEAGIEIFAKNMQSDVPPSPITVARPSRFRSVWYRALALVGLRRNSAGGFGSVVPEPTQSGSGYA
ncbi:MAG: hypothetical protein V2A74_11240 [bacterium]